MSIYSASKIVANSDSMKKLRKLWSRIGKLAKDYEKQRRLSRRQRGWRSAIEYISHTRNINKNVIKSRTRSRIDRYWEGTAFKLHLLKDLLPKLRKQMFLHALRTNATGNRLRIRLAEQLFKRRWKLNVLRHFIVWKHMWLTKKIIADQIDQKERWYIEQSKSLSREIEMLHDELNRIHTRQNDLKIDLAKFKLEEKEIQDALQGLRSDRSYGMKVREEEATLLERLKEVCGSITLYKETLLSLEEEKAYITCEISNNESVLKQNMKYVPLGKVSLQVQSDLSDTRLKVQNTSDETVDKTPRNRQASSEAMVITLQ